MPGFPDIYKYVHYDCLVVPFLRKMIVTIQLASCLKSGWILIRLFTNYGFGVLTINIYGLPTQREEDNHNLRICYFRYTIFTLLQMTRISSFGEEPIRTHDLPILPYEDEIRNLCRWSHKLLLYWCTNYLKLWSLKCQIIKQNIAYRGPVYTLQA